MASLFRPNFLSTPQPKGTEVLVRITPRGVHSRPAYLGGYFELGRRQTLLREGARLRAALTLGHEPFGVVEAWSTRQGSEGRAEAPRVSLDRCGPMSGLQGGAGQLLPENPIPGVNRAGAYSTAPPRAGREITWLDAGGIDDRSRPPSPARR